MIYLCLTTTVIKGKIKDTMAINGRAGSYFLRNRHYEIGTQFNPTV